MAIDAILDGALALPAVERAELAAELLASLERPSALDAEHVRRAWEAELQHRAARLDAGDDGTIDLDAALEQARTNLTA